jgi:uncharacterized protein (DUF2252 family)
MAQTTTGGDVEAEDTSLPEAPPRRSATGRHVLLSPDERAQLGKAARAKVRRRDHAAFEAASDRPDPISLLEEQAVSRVPDLVPIRYGRMLASPFAFFRGAALVMASDLAATPRSGLDVQACGDAHMSNFGVFATPERNLVFDVNDFDETLPGPWEWDLKRLCASLVIAGRGIGFTDAERRAVVIATVESYRTAMREFATMGNMAVWYAKFDIEQNLASLDARLGAKGRQRLKDLLTKAKSKDSLKASSKLTTEVDGHLRFINDPPLIVPVEELAGPEEGHELLTNLRVFVQSYGRSLVSDRRHLVDQFEFVHMARKVVGVGSVGTRAWVMLLVGKDNSDRLILQAKEAQASVLERFTKKCVYANQGERVVAGQRLMQATSDIYLGWDRVTGIDGVARDFYVRQLWDWKGSVDVTMDALPSGTAVYGQTCAWTLARAHARSGDRIAIAAYLGNSVTFAEAIADFSELYADQNDRDHQALQQAVASGRVTAETGV